jgi:hypothetical protein
MSKFDNVLRKISEALPVVQQPAGTAPSSATTNPAQQQYDPVHVTELLAAIAAQNKQQIDTVIQKIKAAQQKPVPGTQPQAAV